MTKLLFLALMAYGVSACGYRYVGQAEVDGVSYVPTISVPYTKGDPEGVITHAVMYALSSSGRFRAVSSGGDLLLQLEVVSDSHSRIGFRYDRDNPSGDREKNLLGVEERRSMEVRIAVEDTRSGKLVLEPKLLSAWADYDYTDPGSPRDLLFSKQDPIMQFSLGQLDSYEGGYDNVMRPLSVKIADKIVQTLFAQLAP